MGKKEYNQFKKETMDDDDYDTILSNDEIFREILVGNYHGKRRKIVRKVIKKESLKHGKIILSNNQYNIINIDNNLMLIKPLFINQNSH